MPANAILEAKVCPFTLELSQSCYFLRHVNEQKKCPYTLELCLFVATEVSRAHLKLKTDASHMLSEIASNRLRFMKVWQNTPLCGRG